MLRCSRRWLRLNVGDARRFILTWNCCLNYCESFEIICEKLLTKFDSAFCPF